MDLIFDLLTFVLYIVSQNVRDKSMNEGGYWNEQKTWIEWTDDKDYNWNFKPKWSKKSDVNVVHISCL